MVLFAKRIALPQVALIRHNDSRLSLDRLQQEANHRRIGQSLPQRIRLVVRDLHEARRKWSKVAIRAGISAHRDHRDGTPMEIVRTHHDLSLLRSYTLAHIAPAPTQLEGGLHTLRSSIHRQQLVITKITAGVFHILTQQIRMESPRGEGQAISLLLQRLNDLGMAMPLVQG